MTAAMACGGGGGAEESDVAPLCADVIAAVVDVAPDGTATIAVTVRSDDLGWEGYADRWELVSSGDVIAERVLLHPHVHEQPFTRSVSGAVLPDGAITVRAHHSTGGFCGAELLIER